MMKKAHLRLAVMAINKAAMAITPFFPPCVCVLCILAVYVRRMR